MMARVTTMAELWWPLMDGPEVDLGKANKYADRLVTKRWRDDSDPCRKGDGFNFVLPAAWPLRVKAVDCLRKCLKEVRRG